MCTTQSYTSLRAKGENRDSCTMNTSIRYDEKMLFFFGKKKHDGAENITTILGQFSKLEKGTFYSKTANFYHKRHLTNFLKHLEKTPSNQKIQDLLENDLSPLIWGVIYIPFPYLCTYHNLIEI